MHTQHHMVYTSVLVSVHSPLPLCILTSYSSETSHKLWAFLWLVRDYLQCSSKALIVVGKPFQQRLALHQLQFHPTLQMEGIHFHCLMVLDPTEHHADDKSMALGLFWNFRTNFLSANVEKWILDIKAKPLKQGEKNTTDTYICTSSTSLQWQNTTVYQVQTDQGTTKNIWLHALTCQRDRINKITSE